MTEHKGHRELKQPEPAERVERDPSAKFVRDLATAPPAKELSMLKAASDAAGLNDGEGDSSLRRKRAGR